jgi:hypothetical protein
MRVSVSFVWRYYAQLSSHEHCWPLVAFVILADVASMLERSPGDITCHDRFNRITLLACIMFCAHPSE